MRGYNGISTIKNSRVGFVSTIMIFDTIIRYVIGYVQFTTILKPYNKVKSPWNQIQSILDHF